MLSSIAVISCAPESDPKPIPPLDPAAASSIISNTPANPPTGTAAEIKALTPGIATRIPLGDLYALVQKDAALIFDVRPRLIYQLGHIPGAISWPKGRFTTDLPKYEPRIKTAINTNTPIVIYCVDLACPDATLVAGQLALLGYSTSVLQGGYEAWKIAAN